MKWLTIAGLLWGLLCAGSARATQPSDLSCEPNPSPLPGDTAVPLNPLLFGFGLDSLTDASGHTIVTAAAPAPWNLDSRYRVPSQPLQPNSAYTMIYELEVTTAPGTFVTAGAADLEAPTAPIALWHGAAQNPNAYAGPSVCATDEAELFGLGPSTDDLTPQEDLRYSVSQVLADGGLQMLFNELTPVTLGDGGLALVTEYGLQGLPGDYVLQARDLAGNLSGPSAAQKVEIAPGCTFASSTTGRRAVSLWPILFLAFLRRHRSARGSSLHSTPR